jgi:hypothetical protein
MLAKARGSRLRYVVAEDSGKNVNAANDFMSAIINNSVALIDAAERSEALADLAARYQWQPIETAPMDGTSFVILYKISITGVWRYDLASFKEDYYTSEKCFSSLHGEDFSCGSYFTPYRDATHWMPLPQPPHLDLPGSPTYRHRASHAALCSTTCATVSAVSPAKE